MFKLSKVLVVLAILALAIVGCQKEPNSPMAPVLSGKVASAIGPVTSATLHVFGGGNSETISIYRVTAPWDETAVTWSSFAGAYDANVWSTFAVGALGWYSVDVTTLVQAWEAGTYANHGMLLDQPPITIRTELLSSESIDASQHPFVVLCDGISCDTIYITLDTYINENEPNTNFGVSAFISIGNIQNTIKEKQGLIQFTLETRPLLAALGDRVWYDDNMNGLQDAGENGVPGVTVQLYDCEGTLLDEMLTDANGNYLFDNLQPGNYNVKFSNLPAGYVFTGQDQGANNAIDSDANPLTGVAACTELVAGETDLTWDAGIYQPQPPQEGCSHTIGYWKNHAGIGNGNQADVVTQYLPIWLGTDGGAKSRLVNNAQLAVDYLSQNVYGTASNGITKLYAQLLGAKLSIADGAADGDIAAVIAAADAFLATHDYLDWSSLSKAQKSMVNGWKDMLDQYNNGLIGPGHCDEETILF